MSQYKITLKTGDDHGAGTDSDIQVQLLGQNNTNSDWFNLDTAYHNDFEQGDIKTYTVSNDGGMALETLSAISIRKLNDSSLGSAWQLKRVHVEDVSRNQCYVGTPTHEWFDNTQVSAQHGVEYTNDQMLTLQKSGPLSEAFKDLLDQAEKVAKATRSAFGF